MMLCATDTPARFSQSLTWSLAVKTCIAPWSALHCKYFIKFLSIQGCGLGLAQSIASALYHIYIIIYMTVFVLYCLMLLSLTFLVILPLGFERDIN